MAQNYDATKDFFERFGDYNVSLFYYENTDGISVEDLYQHFKARLAFEMSEEADHE